MRVAHVITGLGTGGAERMLQRLTAAAGVDVANTVISLTGMGTIGPEIAAAGTPVETIGIRGLHDLPRGYVRLVRLLRRLAPDVVVTWMYHADLIGGWAARRAGAVPVIWNVRTADIRTGAVLSRGTAAVLRLNACLSGLLPRRIVYVAEAARVVHEAAGFRSDRSVVIHNGYAVPDPRARSARGSAVRRTLGIADDALLIGTAGTFGEQKNQVGFVDACAVLGRRFSNARFMLVGRGNTLDAAPLAAAVARTGFPERFYLLGERSDMVDCLSALDAFCLASRGEGMPNVVGEAMAVGTPCLVTNVGDAALLVGGTGLIVPPDDPAALEDGLTRLSEMTVPAREALGSEARRRIEERFTMPRVRDNYENLYRAVLDRG